MGEIVAFPASRSWMKGATCAEAAAVPQDVAIEKLLDSLGEALTSEIAMIVHPSGRTSPNYMELRRLLKRLEREGRVRSTMVTTPFGRELRWHLPGYAPAYLPRKPIRTDGPEDPPPAPTFPGAAAMRA